MKTLFCINEAYEKAKMVFLLQKSTLYVWRKYILIINTIKMSINTSYFLSMTIVHSIWCIVTVSWVVIAPSSKPILSTTVWSPLKQSYLCVHVCLCLLFLFLFLLSTLTAQCDLAKHPTHYTNYMDKDEPGRTLYLLRKCNRKRGRSRGPIYLYLPL